MFSLQKLGEQEVGRGSAQDGGGVTKTMYIHLKKSNKQQARGKGNAKYMYMYTYISYINILIIYNYKLCYNQYMFKYYITNNVLYRYFIFI
jgi:hypothetical protein